MQTHPQFNLLGIHAHIHIHCMQQKNNNKTKPNQKNEAVVPSYKRACLFRILPWRYWSTHTQLNTDELFSSCSWQCCCLQPGYVKQLFTDRAAGFGCFKVAVETRGTVQYRWAGYGGDNDGRRGLTYRPWPWLPHHVIQLWSQRERRVQALWCKDYHCETMRGGWRMFERKMQRWKMKWLELISQIQNFLLEFFSTTYLIKRFIKMLQIWLFLQNWLYRDISSYMRYVFCNWWNSSLLQQKCNVLDYNVFLEVNFKIG